MDENFKIIKSEDGKKVLQASLYVENGTNFDVYYFILEDSNFVEFKENGEELNFKGAKIIDKTFYSKMSPCELHYFLSSNRNLYLVKESDNKFFGWYLFYQYTSKNTIISVQTTRI